MTLGLQSATVGQIAKIKAVDSNGIPTEWEAVDMAEEMPDKLPNPNALTFTGAVEATYDGGVSVEVAIPQGCSEKWEPDIAPSLWAKVLIPDGTVIPEWEQPDSTNPYMTGDKVTHNWKTWVSIVDNNVWEPSVYGWEEISE